MCFSTYYDSFQILLEFEATCGCVCLCPYTLYLPVLVTAQIYLSGLNCPGDLGCSLSLLFVCSQLSVFQNLGSKMNVSQIFPPSAYAKALVP